MNAWFFTMPLLGAATGWLLAALAVKMLFHPIYPKKIAGITFRGIIPARQPVLAAQIGKLAAVMLSIKEIEEKITNPENVKKIMPQAEAHIDDFLRVKLVKAMPMVGMFVGDKTIHTLKALFVTELEQLFPEIMKNYMGRLQEDFNIQETVAAKIAAIPPVDIEKGFYTLLKQELGLIKLFGAAMGFIIGGIQLLFILLLQR